MDTLTIYVDGSFIGEETGWGYVIVNGDEVVKTDFGVLTGEITSMHQVGGELKAVIEAVQYCKKNDKQAVIYYDYEGIEKWIADLFGGKPWKTNNEWTTKYRTYMLKHKDFIRSMTKVKSHTGVKFNEMADEICKRGLKKKK
jgi:ribonuclease HI